jgi:hypothetical protein
VLGLRPGGGGEEEGEGYGGEEGFHGGVFGFLFGSEGGIEFPLYGTVVWVLLEPLAQVMGMSKVSLAPFYRSQAMTGASCFFILRNLQNRRSK